jgi:anti-anti-sigma factor
MAAFAPVTVPTPTAVPDAGATSRRRTLELDIRRVSPTAVAISAHGDIDAVNCSELTDYAVGMSARCRELVIDFSDVDSFGVEGLRALELIIRSCAKVGGRCVLVPSAAVSRLLRRCGPTAVPLTAPSVEVAVALLGRSATRPLHLLTNSP